VDLETDRGKFHGSQSLPTLRVSWFPAISENETNGGGAPVGDWTVYLVFDPTDSLSAAASHRESGKLSGIPCDVDEVRRLESHWYSVTLSMNEWWEQCK
jgi:hypothetical protein